MKKKFLLLSFIFSFAINSFSTNIDAYRALFDSAEVYFINENYKEALPLYLRLNTMQTDNYNTNFKIGFCYLNAPTYKTKAIPYLEKAITNISKNYKENDIEEVHAPLSSYYYLAKAYHLNYEFDKAIEKYTYYKSQLNTEDASLKSEIQDIEHDIETCKTGKDLVLSPKKVIITNLGDAINTEYPDFSPVVSLDEQTLIFTSRRPDLSALKEPNGEYFEDIFISRVQNGQWTKAASIGSKVNTLGHEAVVNLSADGRQLLVYRDDTGNGNLYLSELTGEEWGAPKELAAPINSSAWESHACISADNKYLYFVSNREGGYGGKDIYKCLRLPNGNWGPAQNIGPEINTKYDEDGVFIHPDGKQIYFASKGHNSMGGFDIFTSTINNENGYWTTPVNFGAPVNTPDDEVFYITTADGNRAFFSSDKEGGFGEKDIYMLTYPEVEQRDITVLIGRIINKTNFDISNNRIDIIDISNNDTIQTLEANSRSGKYGANLPLGKVYKTVYYVNGRLIFSEELDATKKEGYKVITREIPYISDSVVKVAPILEQKYVCNPKAALLHYFIYNEMQLIKSEEFKLFIKDLTVCFKANENITINIESSASKVPTNKYKDNIFLAKKRANDAEKNITQALIKNGVKKEKIKFSPHKASVNGPEYKNDYDKKDKIYEQYQYTKATITIK